MDKCEFPFEIPEGLAEELEAFYKERSKIDFMKEQQDMIDSLPDNPLDVWDPMDDYNEELDFKPDEPEDVIKKGIESDEFEKILKESKGGC